MIINTNCLWHFISYPLAFPDLDEPPDGFVRQSDIIHLQNSCEEKICQICHLLLTDSFIAR